MNKKVFIRKPRHNNGFALSTEQIEGFIKRAEADRGIQDISLSKGARIVITPHDDYCYVGSLYPRIFKTIKAGTVFLIGVAHNAREFNIENKLVFDSFNYWKGPFGMIKVSDIRFELMERIPNHSFTINNNLHEAENSLEALIPLLQFYNHNIEIVPILVSAMSLNTMDNVSLELTNAIADIISDRKWSWGDNFALIISSDAVHYGNKGWNGADFAFLGSGNRGNELAKEYDQKIINSICGKLSRDKIESFIKRTVQENNFREYKWTWCGRYSVPFGLLTGLKLSRRMGEYPPEGIDLGYRSSLDSDISLFANLQIGVTAASETDHWVGYPGIVYI